MQAAKRARLEAGGWIYGDAKDFLGLTVGESEYIELMLDLAAALKQWRVHRNLTRSQVAILLKMSHSQVLRIEKGDPRVGVDLFVRSLLTLGATRRDLANIIQGRSRPRRG